MRIFIPFAAGFLVACNATHNPVTSAGTVLLEWDNTLATRADFAKATVGARTTKDFIVNVTPKDTPPIALDLHVEFAPVDFEQGGKMRHHTAAVAIKVTVKDNTGWELSGKCDDPNYQFGPFDDGGAMQAPSAMIQDCSISEHRIAGTVLKSSWAIGFTLNLYGDGTVKSFPDTDVEIRNVRVP